MPSQKMIQLSLVVTAEGYSALFTPTEVGEHKVEVTYAEMPLPKSPYSVMVEIAVEVSRVIVRGLETRKFGLSQAVCCLLSF